MTSTSNVWDLCIVGAGIAGLNALHVATEYLPAGARVLLIDKRGAPGGMWNSTYDHVRLHQPYAFFTVGDIPWALGKQPSHLADRFEVLEHMRHCLDVIRSRVDLHEWYGCSYEEHHEELVGGGPRAVVTVRTAQGERVEVRARRFIEALGFNAWPDRPIALSSERVRSITPESWDFLGPEMSADDAPIVVVGGGKTGVDAAYHATKRYPGRRVLMLSGSGTAFLDRDALFPTTTRGKLTGSTMFEVASDLATRFDGDNEDVVYDHFVETYGLEFDGTTSARCIYGFLSQEEKRVIDANVDVRNRYLADVRDTESGPELVFRDGAREPLPEGSWIVNCTGVLLKDERGREVALSPLGTTLNLTTGASFSFLTSYGGYCMAHLWFAGVLDVARICLMDHVSLLRANPKAYMFASAAQLVHNTMSMQMHLSSDVLARCGLVFDNWYPLHRRMLAYGSMRVRRASTLRHLRATLARLDRKYDVARPVPPRTKPPLALSRRALLSPDGG